MLSNCNISNIKFHSSEGNLFAWLKKERVFLESDKLGTDCPITIGYFTKIELTLTHLANFCDHLVNQLLMVDIEADTVVKLAPHLKHAQLDAMTNSNEYIPILSEFKTYRMRLSHSQEPSKVMTNVLGIKCVLKDAKLLGEFFTRMAADTSYRQRDGVYLPKGVAYLLGPQTYDQVLKENNFFFNNVAMIPINMEYEAWFAVIDPTNTTETDPLSLYDQLTCKTWFLRIESGGRNKSIIVTTKSNLPDAHAC